MSEIENVYDIYQFMNDQNIVFAYTGEFDHAVTTLLLKSIKRELKGADSERSIDKKVYHILVESIENMSKHTSNENAKQNTGLLLLCKLETKYVIITGNYIANKEVTKLQEKLDKVSKLSQDELKKVYREQILSPRTDENGAGLGIIDIAIKSGNNIKYDFQPRTDEMSFYLFQTELNFN